ncbi:hypothetical protein JXB31_04105 [Candidatus Woesearchaeota archaeon]|nr:hypothetical protein [Candidatus Woesearchaeota archaeon]
MKKMQMGKRHINNTNCVNKINNTNKINTLNNLNNNSSFDSCLKAESLRLGSSAVVCLKVACSNLIGSRFKRLKNRGMLFSIDAMIAAMVAIIMILAINSISSNAVRPSYSELNLYHIAADSLVVLKANEEFSGVLTSSSTERIHSFMNNIMPENVCSYVRIYNKLGYQMISRTKNGCPVKIPEKSVLLSSPFIYNNNIFIAEMVVWYK